jgi:serine protease
MRHAWSLFALAGALVATSMAGVAVELGLAPVTDQPLNHWIVGFYALPEDRTAYLGQKVVRVDEDLKFLVVEVGNLAALRKGAQEDQAVRYLEYDDPFWARLHLVPNDPKYSDAGHWGSKKIGAETAWDVTLGSTSVKVAMIDSGLNKGHEEYSGQSRVLQGWDYYQGDNTPQDTSYCSWHGTHTTGTAGATINNNKGIAGLSQHTILPLKIFHGVNPGPYGCKAATTSGIADALKAAGDNGAHVSSNSWGGGASSTTINDAITYSHNKGTLHVAAAGNSGPCTNCVGTPWKDVPGIVIIVSSSTSSDGFSSFSSEGPQVDVIAPGSSILSSTSGTTGYGTLSGTSMAAPHAAGTVALIKAKNPTFGTADLENRLKSTAVNIGLSSDKQGSGRISASGAVF